MKAQINLSSVLGWRKISLSLLTGALIIAAFPPYCVFPLIWISLVPWLFAIANLDPFKHSTSTLLKSPVLRLGLFASFSMTLTGFFWIATVLEEFGKIPSIAAFSLLLIYAFFGQLQFPIFSLIFYRFRKFFYSKHHHTLLLFTLALLYTGLDWLLPKLFTDTLGHSTYQAKDLRQAAELGTPYLLTFAITWMNLGFLKVLLSKPKAYFLAQKKYVPLLAPLFFALSLTFFGYIRRIDLVKTEQQATQHFQVAAIQANIGDFDKIAAERGVKDAARKVLNAYYQLTTAALSLTPKPQAIIWPETSYPSTFRSPGSSEELMRDQELEQFGKMIQTPLFFGGYDYKNNLDYNSFFLLTPKPQGYPPNDLQTYHKNKLLLFGETIPGADFFPWIKLQFPQVGNFGRGPGPSIMTLEDLNLNSTTQIANNTQEFKSLITGPVICYEILFTQYVRGAIQKGSQLILNVTNDSWFGSWAEPDLHLALSTFRSIEMRVPTLRSTNTGFTTWIDTTGEIREPSKLNEAQILNYTIPLSSRPNTLVYFWGDWFGPFALAVSLALLFWLNSRFKQDQN